MEAVAEAAVRDPAAGIDDRQVKVAPEVIQIGVHFFLHSRRIPALEVGRFRHPQQRYLNPVTATERDDLPHCTVGTRAEAEISQDGFVDGSKVTQAMTISSLVRVRVDTWKIAIRA